MVLKYKLRQEPSVEAISAIGELPKRQYTKIVAADKHEKVWFSPMLPSI